MKASGLGAGETKWSRDDGLKASKGCTLGSHTTVLTFPIFEEKQASKKQQGLWFIPLFIH